MALFALSVALSLAWSLKNGFPKRSYYAVGLVSPQVHTPSSVARKLWVDSDSFALLAVGRRSMQLALALVFLGFDYSFGLSLLSASFYMAFRTATRNAAVACDEYKGPSGA